MSNLKKLNERRGRRKRRTRGPIFGTSERPRLSVFRSNRNLYCQLIDDERGHTLTSASSREVPKKLGNKTTAGREIGRIVAEKARQLGIKRAIFDKGAYKYHGRIKAIAEAAREAGLKI